MTNLYGWTMNEYLPYCGFECLENIDNFDITSINDKNPEKLTVSNDMLSKYCKKIGDEHEIKLGDVKKLIPNFGNKTNYIVH